MNVLEISQSGALLDLVLSRPEDGNKLSNEEADRLASSLATLPASVSLVRLRSSGDTFCVGRVSPMASMGATATAGDLKREVADPALRVYDALRSCPVPVLSIVAGAAHGFGCGLVGASDLAIASAKASFRIPEMERGIPPTLVMTALRGRISRKALFHLVLTKEEINAARALECGLISKVVAPEALDRECALQTEALLSYPGESMRAIKDYLMHADGMHDAGATALAANILSTTLSARSKK